ncbi:MAG: hypothetical protein VB144_02060 [Clostridia bacterium]|nr:hypothetical protein [Clostridia bacterium]
MNRSRIVVLLIGLLLVGSVSIAAAEPKKIPGWADAMQDMEVFKGALSKALGDETVLLTYLPGYGVVFVFATYHDDISLVQRQIERALRFIVPAVSLVPSGQKLVIAGRYDSSRFDSVWELMYVSTPTSSGDPNTWTIYINRLSD